MRALPSARHLQTFLSGSRPLLQSQSALPTPSAIRAGSRAFSAFVGLGVAVLAAAKSGRRRCGGAALGAAVREAATAKVAKKERADRAARAVDVLRRAAAEPGSERPGASEVLDAIVRLQRGGAAVRQATFLELLAGGGSPGRRWRLVFVANKDSVRAARNAATGAKGPTAAGPFGSLYVDGLATAVQRFDSETMENENGFFGLLGFGLGRLFTVKGPFKWPTPEKRNTCAFQPTTVCLGPVELPMGDTDTGGTSFDETPVRKLPFFNFLHVDDLVAVAQGASGGMAVWSRTNEAFEREQMRL